MQNDVGVPCMMNKYTEGLTVKIYSFWEWTSCAATTNTSNIRKENICNFEFLKKEGLGFLLDVIITKS
jgi:hypothetical protein